MGQVSPEARMRIAGDAVARSITTKSRLDGVLPAVVAVAEAVGEALRAGGKVLVFGNGGSAADAQHIAAELVGRYVRERPGMPAIALTTDTSALTAIANDYGYDEVFRRQVQALARAGDVAIGISTSGNSPSVVNGLTAAAEAGAATVAFTGGKPSRCAEVADHVIAIPAVETARIQECHLLLGHVICELLDADDEIAAPASCDRVSHGVPAELLAARDEWRSARLRVVLTNGVFDLLHAGHVASLEAARRLGDVLVVAVNCDATVRELKGADRPVVGEQQRARMLAALRAVDHVVVFDEPDAAGVIERLRPDVWCKGRDYEGRDPETIPELPVLRAYGGELAFLDLVDGVSTSDLVQRIRS